MLSKVAQTDTGIMWYHWYIADAYLRTHWQIANHISFFNVQICMDLYNFITIIYSHILNYGNQVPNQKELFQQ